MSSTVRGGEHVIARFASIGAGVQERMVAVLEKFAIDLQSHVLIAKLSGQVLARRSGRLAGSINQRVEQKPGVVSAVVGANLREAKYAEAHEYGFRGTVAVSAHVRMITKAFGKKIKPTAVNVRAHTMKMNLPERSFLRSSLKDKGPEGVAEIRGALMEMLKENAP